MFYAKKNKGLFEVKETLNEKTGPIKQTGAHFFISRETTGEVWKSIPMNRTAWGVATGESHSNLQVSHREAWERRSNSKIVA